MGVTCFCWKFRNADEINYQFCAEIFCWDKEGNRSILRYVTFFWRRISKIDQVKWQFILEAFLRQKGQPTYRSTAPQGILNYVFYLWYVMALTEANASRGVAFTFTYSSPFSPIFSTKAISMFRFLKSVPAMRTRTGSPNRRISPEFLPTIA